MVSRSQRAAVLVFGPKFSEQVTHCSFLANGVNPYFRDGVNLEVLDARLITDPTQITAASIIEQVAQVTTLRVVMPWIIGRPLRHDRQATRQLRQRGLARNVSQLRFDGYFLGRPDPLAPANQWARPRRPFPRRTDREHNNRPAR